MASERVDTPIDFQTSPDDYRHWRVEYDGNVACVYMQVDENGGLFDGYLLQLNSYDLGVDIELADIVQRLRFEQPQVGAVLLRSGNERVFCAGANIRMLGGASHAHKVNFCKFTNETRNTFEASGEDSGQPWLCAIRGACAGGGYELALACEHIMLADDGSSSVALPEAPLLAVLPGTGGLTRVTDKRRVRRDLADVFCSLEEGVRGTRAVEWKLVDELLPNSEFDAKALQRAREFSSRQVDKTGRQGIQLQALQRQFAQDADGRDTLHYPNLKITIDRSAGTATLTLAGPTDPAPDNIEQLHELGAQYWLLALARELDDALLHLRLNELETGLLVFKTQGQLDAVAAHEQFMAGNSDDWLVAEILQYWKRVLKRVDVTSRSLVTLVENGSCFCGVLAELLFAADRAYMMEGEFEDDDRPTATIMLGDNNFGPMPMANGLSRLQTRFLEDETSLANAEQAKGRALDAQAASELGLVTYCFDEFDWDDEVRIFIEERNSFSPDALTGLEANLRFAGPETMETRIFARLTAWQNWIFQRPNAVGENGALQRYGTGKRGEFDRRRV